MHVKIKPIRKMNVPDINNTLDSLVAQVDRVIQLGYEIKEVYSSPLKSKKIVKSDPNTVNRILTEGDNISKELDSLVIKLQTLRKYLPYL